MTEDLPAKPAYVFKSQKPPTEPVLSAPPQGRRVPGTCNYTEPGTGAAGTAVWAPSVLG